MRLVGVPSGRLPGSGAVGGVGVRSSLSWAQGIVVGGTCAEGSVSGGKWGCGEISWNGGGGVRTGWSGVLAGWCVALSCARW